MHSHKLKLVIFFIFAVVVSIGANDACAQYRGFDSPTSRLSGGGALGLIPVESSVDGGSIPIGASAQVVVLFRNEGAQEVETGLINLYPSSNIAAEISLNQCASGLPSGAECAIAISVKGLQAGAWRLEMLMRHSGRTRLVTATISGSVEASSDNSDRMASDVEAIPDDIDFGSLSSSQTLIESVILRNTTSSAINISEVSMNAADSAGYTVQTDCAELSAGQACIATIVWEPKRTGPASGVIIVRHDGPTALTSIAVNGEYEPDEVEKVEEFPEAVPGRGLLVSSQTEFDFGDNISAASTMTVSLVNTGDTALTLEEIKISGSDSGLTLAGTGCSEDLTLQPIEACPLTLTWSPTRLGSVVDDVQVVHDGARGILVLPVRGEATSTVSQDQKAIVISSSNQKVKRTIRSSDDEILSDDSGVKKAKKSKKTKKKSKPASHLSSTTSVMNSASALDGLKITSFSADRAIVNGPGGSRLVFDGEPIMLGGVMWDVSIQRNGIEFINETSQVLLLFDRSLSSVSRVGQSSSSASSSSSSSGG